MLPQGTTAQVVDIPPGTRFRDHGHDDIHLCAVVAGSFAEQTGKWSELMSPGRLRLSPPARHDIQFGQDGARCLLVHVGEQDARAVLPRPIPRSRFLLDSRLGTLAHRLASTAGRRGGSALMEELTLELLAQVSRHHARREPGSPPSWLLAVRDRMAEEWVDPPTAAELAREAGVHRVHLVRSFRAHFGCTLGTFVRRRRLAHARELLARADLPIAWVAMESGFADQAHLTRTLRRSTGRTPGQLRRAGEIE